MGLRVGEVVALDVGDLIGLRSKSATILVHRKGQKQQVLPLTRDARTALRRWVRVRPDVPSPALFLPAPVPGGPAATPALLEHRAPRCGLRSARGSQPAGGKEIPPPPAHGRPADGGAGVRHRGDAEPARTHEPDHHAGLLPGEQSPASAGHAEVWMLAGRAPLFLVSSFRGVGRHGEGGAGAGAALNFTIVGSVLIRAVAVLRLG